MAFGSQGEKTYESYMQNVQPGFEQTAGQYNAALQNYLAGGGQIPEAMRQTMQQQADITMEQMMADINRQAGMSREATLETLRRKGLVGQGVTSGETGGALSLLEARRVQNIADASRAARGGMYNQMMQTQRWLPGMMAGVSQLALPGAQMGLQEYMTAEQLEAQQQMAETQAMADIIGGIASGAGSMAGSIIGGR